MKRRYRHLIILQIGGGTQPISYDESGVPEEFWAQQINELATYPYIVLFLKNQMAFLDRA